MSTIDIYKHKLLGYIECPSTYSFVNFNEKTRRIGVYRLLENIALDTESIDGKIGDILLGGGNGEAPAFRISSPLAFQFFTLDEDAFCELEFECYSDIFKAYWSPTESYILCEGFSKLGWTVEQDIELWLAENICKLLISTIKDYSGYRTGQLDLKTNLQLLDGAG